MLGVASGWLCPLPGDHETAVTCGSAESICDTADAMASSSAPRILLVARELPAAPRDGGGLRRRHLVDALGHVGPTAAFALAGGPPPSTDLVAWRTASDPAAARTPEGPGVVEALRAGHSPLAVVDSPSAVAELVAFVHEVQPDVVVVSGVELFAHVDVLRPLVPSLVFDLDYAQAVGLGEMAAADPHRARGLLWRHVLHRVADDERAVLAAVDQVWVSNQPERARVDRAKRVAVVPNVVDVDSYPHAARRDAGALVYPARFDFWPNQEAARLLLDDVLPHLPDATLTLVGSSPPEWLQARASDRVHVTGPVPDIRPHLAAAAAMPVPLMAGAGTRLKVLEAFAVGLPVVSTAKGVEGLPLEPGHHYMQAETAPEFVAALEQLGAEPERPDRMVAHARAWVEQHGSLSALRDAVDRALADVTVG